MNRTNALAIFAAVTMLLAAVLCAHPHVLVGKLAASILVMVSMFAATAAAFTPVKRNTFNAR